MLGKLASLSEGGTACDIVRMFSKEKELPAAYMVLARC